MFEIGDSLRAARLRRGLDFGQGEQATKIRSKYLRALEDEHFDQLPSPTYVKGFLNAYAEYLGLDGQLYVDEYNSRFATGEESDGPRRSRVRPAQRERRLETSIVVVSVALIAIVTVVVISAWQVSGGGGAKPPASGAARTGSSLTRTTAALPMPGASLRIEALSGGSYVEVHRNGPSGTMLFQGTVTKGKDMPFAGKYFWLTVSSPSDLAIVVDGVRIRLPGSKPAALTITPSGVRSD